MKALSLKLNSKTKPPLDRHSHHTTSVLKVVDKPKYLERVLSVDPNLYVEVNIKNVITRIFVYDSKHLDTSEMS